LKKKKKMMMKTVLAAAFGVIGVAMFITNK